MGCGNVKVIVRSLEFFSNVRKYAAKFHFNATKVNEIYCFLYMMYIYIWHDTGLKKM